MTKTTREQAKVIFVKRIVKFAKEQITMGRNYGWSVDTLTEELEHLLEKERINGAIEARDVIAKELKSLAEALLKIKPKESQ